MNVEIKQNDTVAVMKMRCVVNESKKDITCTTDYPLLYQTTDVLSAISIIPVVGTIARAVSMVAKLGQETVDTAMGLPLGSSRQRINNAVSEFSQFKSSTN